MGHNQANVREVYLQVIQSTIDRAKAAFEEEEGGEDEQLNATLDRLSEQWRTRLLENHDFTDDPTAITRSNTGRGGSSATKKARAVANSAAAEAAKAQAAAAAAAPQAPALPGVSTLPGALALPGQPDAMGGQIPLPGDLGGGSLAIPAVSGDASAAGALPGIQQIVGAPAVPAAVNSSVGKVEPAAAGVPAAGAPGSNGAAPASPTAPPPAKRARRAAEEEVVNDNEDLDSEDSDDIDGSNGDDEGNAENYILAQNDSVKKGGGNGKWKVRLKDGILHMNGRDYLFSKANCDLDW